MVGTEKEWGLVSTDLKDSTLKKIHIYNQNKTKYVCPQIGIGTNFLSQHNITPKHSY